MRTPEDTASKLVDTWVTENGVHISPVVYARLVAMVVRALRVYGDERARAERERAAQTAETFHDTDDLKREMRLAARLATDAGAGDALGAHYAAREIAARIRALD